eukprot:765106-Prorocentrum_lima.AAC.1
MPASVVHSKCVAAARRLAYASLALPRGSTKLAEAMIVQMARQIVVACSVDEKVEWASGKAPAWLT